MECPNGPEHALVRLRSGLQKPTDCLPRCVVPADLSEEVETVTEANARDDESDDGKRLAPSNNSPTTAQASSEFYDASKFSDASAATSAAVSSVADRTSCGETSLAAVVVSAPGPVVESVPVALSTAIPATPSASLESALNMFRSLCGSSSAVDAMLEQVRELTVASQDQEQIASFLMQAAQEATALPDSSVSEAARTTSTAVAEPCVICYDQPREVAFAPCRHNVCCTKCASTLVLNEQLSKCPMCRTALSVDDITWVYE